MSGTWTSLSDPLSTQLLVRARVRPPSNRRARTPLVGVRGREGARARDQRQSYSLFAFARRMMLAELERLELELEHTSKAIRPVRLRTLLGRGGARTPSLMSHARAAYALDQYPAIIRGRRDVHRISTSAAFASMGSGERGWWRRRRFPPTKPRLYDRPPFSAYSSLPLRGLRRMPRFQIADSVSFPPPNDCRPSSNVRPSFSKDRQYSSNSSNSSTHADLTPYRSSSADALNPTGFPSGSSRSHMTSNHSPPSSPQSSSTKAARINFSGTGTSDDSSSAPFSNFQQRYRKHASQSSVHPLGSGRGYDDPDKNYWAMGLGDLGDQDSDDDENLDGRPAGPGFMKGFSGAGVGVRKFVGVTGKSQGVAPIGSSIPHYFPSSKDPSSSKSHHHDHLSGTISPSTVSDLVSNPEGRERLEWQTMLSSVLSGEVLRSEKTRIGGERPTNEVLRNEMGSNLWWGIRAILRGRGPAEEEKRVGQRRERTVDAILEEVSNFCVVDPPPAEPATSFSTDTSSTPSASTPSGSTAPTSIANLNIPSLSPESTSTPLANPDSTPTGPAAHGIDSAASPIHPSAFDQVLAILAKLSHAESLYPHCRALRNAKPLYDSEEFQKRVEALVSWSNVVLSLRTQIGILVKWTGSEELDVKKVDSEEPIRGAPGSARGSNQGTPGSASSASAGPPSRGSGISSMTGVGEDGKPLRPPTFVERVMKEDSLQRTFEKKTLSDLYALISSAKSTYLQHSEIFQKLNLPPYQTELTKLISFPMQLMEESLKVRLAYALKLEDPTVIVIDQLTEGRLQMSSTLTLSSSYSLTPHVQLAE
jgi:hypothetical protein